MYMIWPGPTVWLASSSVDGEATRDEVVHGLVVQIPVEDAFVLADAGAQRGGVGQRRGAAKT